MRIRLAFLQNVSAAIKQFVYGVGTQAYGQLGFGNGNFQSLAPVQRPYSILQLMGSYPSSVPYSVGEKVYQGSSLATATAVGTFISFTAGGYYNMLINWVSGTWTPTGTVTGTTHPSSYNYTAFIGGAIEPDIVTQVALRFRTAMMVKSDGTLWTVGSNGNGQLANGTTSGTYYQWAKVAGVTNAVAVAPGDEFCAYLDSNGNIWTVGNNAIAAQCHNGSQGGSDLTAFYNTSLTSSVTHPALMAVPVASGTFSPNEFVYLGGSATSPTWIARVMYHDTVNGILAVSGSSGTLAAGTIRGASSGVTASVTGATTPPVFKAINVGHRWLGAIDSYGFLWTWGNNGGSGECGRLSQLVSSGALNNTYPSGTTASDVLPNGNSTQDWNCRLVSLPFSNGIPVKVLAVYPGAYNGLCLGADGNIYGWGSNSYNQMGATNAGAATTLPHVIPCANGYTWISGDSGDYHTMLIRSDGTLWGAGQNGNGQIGNNSTSNPNDYVQIALPVVGGVTGYWKSVSCGYVHTLAIDNLGNLWGWGDNSQKQLGLTGVTNQTTPVLLDSSRSYSQISCGEYASLGLALT